MGRNESSFTATAVLLIFWFLNKGRFESFGFGGCALINLNHLSGNVGKELINILSSFCRGLHELDSVFLGLFKERNT